MSQDIRRGDFSATGVTAVSQVLDRPEPHGGRPGDRFDPLMALPVSYLSTWITLQF